MLGCVAIQTGKSHWLITDNRVVLLCAIAVEGLTKRIKSASDPMKIVALAKGTAEIVAAEAPTKAVEKGNSIEHAGDCDTV